MANMFDKISINPEKEDGNSLDIFYAYSTKKFSISAKNKFGENINIFISEKESIRLINFITKRIKNGG